jgi:hypothetical protein
MFVPYSFDPGSGSIFLNVYTNGLGWWETHLGPGFIQGYLGCRSNSVIFLRFPNQVGFDLGQPGTFRVMSENLNSHSDLFEDP